MLDVLQKKSPMYTYLVKKSSLLLVVVFFFARFPYGPSESTLEQTEQWLLPCPPILMVDSLPIIKLTSKRCFFSFVYLLFVENRNSNLFFENKNYVVVRVLLCMSSLIFCGSGGLARRVC